MFGISPAMISMFVKGELDKIISGIVPDMVRVKERTDKKIVLVPNGLSELDGISVVSFDGVFMYRGIEFVITHE